MFEKKKISVEAGSFTHKQSEPVAPHQSHVQWVPGLCPKVNHPPPSGADINERDLHLYRHFTPHSLGLQALLYDELYRSFHIYLLLVGNFQKTYGSNL
jgi:hypothetical protein